ncbi:hypothetical protein M8C21_008636, partial [Ambrosia artemisiifolia]
SSVLSSLIALRFLARDTTQFFVASEFVHAAGIILLIYKLTKQKTCSGLSLKTQELTAIFLAVRLCCSLCMENDIHTFLDFAALASTLWVVYMIRYKLQATYNEDLDNIPKYYLVYESAGAYLYLLGTGYYLWLPAVLLAEVVQTFILADFCYYYVKSVVNGHLLVSLPPV